MRIRSTPGPKRAWRPPDAVCEAPRTLNVLTRNEVGRDTSCDRFDFFLVFFSTTGLMTSSRSTIRCGATCAPDRACSCFAAASSAGAAEVVPAASTSSGPPGSAAASSAGSTT